MMLSLIFISTFHPSLGSILRLEIRKYLNLKRRDGFKVPPSDGFLFAGRSVMRRDSDSAPLVSVEIKITSKSVDVRALMCFRCEGLRRPVLRCYNKLRREIRSLLQDVCGSLRAPNFYANQRYYLVIFSEIRGNFLLPSKGLLFALNLRVRGTDSRRTLTTREARDLFDCLTRTGPVSPERGKDGCAKHTLQGGSNEPGKEPKPSRDRESLRA